MSELVHVKGLAELDKFLETLPMKIQNNIMRGALRAGMKPVKADAQEHAAVASGQLRDGLKLYTRVRSRVVTVILRATGKHGYVARWVEFGTAAHLITAKNRKGLAFGGLFFQSVWHPGIQPHPFMRPALDARAGDAVVAAGEYIKNRLATKEGLDTADIVIEGDE
jgi:HK97 gp10 family phage protein